MNAGQTVESKTPQEITNILNGDSGLFLIEGNGSTYQITKLKTQEVAQRDRQQAEQSGQKGRSVGV